MKDTIRSDDRGSSLEDQGRKTILLLRWILIIVIGYLVVFSSPVQPLLSLPYGLLSVYILSNLILILSPRKWFEKDIFIFFILLADIGMTSLAIFVAAGIDSDLYLIYFLNLFIAAFTQRSKFVYFSAGLLMISYGLLSYVRNSLYFLEPFFLLRFPFIFVVSFFFCLMIESVNQVRKEKERLKEDYRELEVLTELAHSIGHNKNLSDFLITLTRTLCDKLLLQRCMSILVDSLEKHATIVSSDDPPEKEPMVIDLIKYPLFKESLSKDMEEVSEKMLPEDKPVSEYILKEVPLSYQDKKMGILYLRVNTPYRKLTHREEYFLSRLSQITATAIYNLEKPK